MHFTFRFFNDFEIAILSIESYTWQFITILIKILNLMILKEIWIEDLLKFTD